MAEFKPAVGQAVSLLSTVVDTAGDLGVVLDRQLSLDTHVTAVFRSGDYGTVAKGLSKPDDKVGRCEWERVGCV